MDKENKIELFMAVFSGFLALVGLLLQEFMPKSLSAILFCFGCVGCLFFSLSFNQRSSRKK